jgi:hypothetical protein
LTIGRPGEKEKYLDMSWSLGAAGWNIFSLIQPQQQTQLGPKLASVLPPNIRSLVSDLAKRRDCANILNKFAEKLGAIDDLDATQQGKTFVESVFDNLSAISINNNISGAQTDGSTIWVRDYTNNMLRPPFDPTKQSMSVAAQKAAWARYIIQELVHNFRRKGQFDDRVLDRVGRAILDEMDSTVAANLRKAFAESGKREVGGLGHFLVNQYCEYSQQEVDNGQPND